MAIKKSITLESNFGDLVVFTDAYIKVVNLGGNKENLSADYAVLKEKDGRFLKAGSVSFAPVLEGDNFIAQAYEQLKTLPEFADAVDC